MQGVLGDSLLIGLAVTIFLLLTVGVWYTVGVRFWRRIRDSIREAADDVKRDDDYDPLPSGLSPQETREFWKKRKKYRGRIE